MFCRPRGRFAPVSGPSKKKNTNSDCDCKKKQTNKRFKNIKSNILILGGDSANDLKRRKNVSSGGGSSLKYISNNRLEIITELYKNKRIFKKHRVKNLKK